MQKYGAYPSFEDYTVFVANRLVVHGKHRTLPAAFETLARQTLSETVAVQALLTAAEFVKRWDASVATKDRVEIECCRCKDICRRGGAASASGDSENGCGCHRDRRRDRDSDWAFCCHWHWQCGQPGIVPPASESARA